MPTGDTFFLSFLARSYTLLILILGLTCFFGFIAVAFIILFVINCIAKKYLNGDFTKIPPDDDEYIDQPFIEIASDTEDTVDQLNESKICLPAIGTKNATLQLAKSENFLNDLEVEDKQHIKPGKSLPIISKENSDEKFHITAGKSQTLLSRSRGFFQASQEVADGKSKDTAFQNSFASNAILTATVQYYQSNKSLFINIEKIDGLYLLEISRPTEINFHVKLRPKYKNPIRTKWKHIPCDKLLLTFTIGPLTEESLPRYNLYIRLYGRNKKLSRAKCHGECIISLNELLSELDMRKTFEKKILPKSGNYMESDGYLTDDNLI